MAGGWYIFRSLCFISCKQGDAGCKLVSGNNTHLGMYRRIDDRYRVGLEKVEKIREIDYNNDTIPISRNIPAGVSDILHLILNLGVPLDYHAVLGAGVFIVIYIVSRA